MSTTYADEGDLFWTFFGYLDKCFAPAGALHEASEAKSFDECYDWSTVIIKGKEEVGTLDKCVKESFAVVGDIETDNKILREDRQWANANHLQMHPSVTINNSTFTNSTGEDLALAICAAYREAPDECEIAWKVASFGQNETYDGLKTPHDYDKLYS